MRPQCPPAPAQLPRLQMKPSRGLSLEPGQPARHPPWCAVPPQARTPPSSLPWDVSPPDGHILPGPTPMPPSRSPRQRARLLSPVWSVLWEDDTSRVSIAACVSLGCRARSVGPVMWAEGKGRPRSSWKPRSSTTESSAPREAPRSVEPHLASVLGAMTHVLTVDS